MTDLRQQPSSTIANPILAALDMTSTEEALALAGRLRGAVGGIKLGLEFYMARGAAGNRAAARPQPSKPSANNVSSV